MIDPAEQSDPSGAETSPTPPITRLRGIIGRLPLLTVAAVVLVVVGLAFLVLSLGGSNDRPLYPILPTFTPLAGTAAFAPQEIGFAELNADPAAFQDHRLQMTGAYTPIEAPECLDYNGPSIRWSLVAEELQLNAIGFEPLLPLVEEGTEMTVTGIWRAYQGPVGCGKEPPDGTVWYLEVDRILAPNPLFGSAGPLLTVIAGTSDPLTPDLLGSETPAVATATPAETILVTPTATLQEQPVLIPTGTPTPSLTPLPVTPLVPPGTPSETGTPGGTATTTGTPGPSPTPTVTASPEGSTTPGLPTNTPSGTGYPAQGTPTPTSTTTGNSYP
jgi:hypothetical protein